MEEDVQKKLVGFCKVLPSQVELWRKVLEDMQNPVKALVNFTEQLQCVEQANINYLDDFGQVQAELATKILFHIEEELETIKMLTEKLNKSNHDLKNKLATLERATIDLNWELDSLLIKGSATQPRLDKLLRMGYDFWKFFSNTSKNINSKRKALNIRERKSVEDFQKSFFVELSLQGEYSSQVHRILALTQYVINDKAVT